MGWGGGVGTKIIHLSIYIPWPFPPVWGVADNTKETTKNNRGFTLFFQECRGIQPSLDGTAGATQPILPRLPQPTSLHRCCLPYCPYHRAASTRQPRGNSRCQSELRHNHSPLIPIPSTLTCLPYIHPPIIQGSLYSIHPPKPWPPSTHISLENTSFYSTTLFPIHSLNNSATPSLALPLSTPDTLPVTSPNATSPFPFIFVSHKANTSIHLLPNIHPISLLLLSIELHPRTFNDPTTRVWGEVNLPATPLLSCCLWGKFYRGGDSQSPRPVYFSRLLQHAENTLVLFFVICPTPQGIKLFMSAKNKGQIHSN